MKKGSAYIIGLMSGEKMNAIILKKSIFTITFQTVTGSVEVLYKWGIMRYAKIKQTDFDKAVIGLENAKKDFDKSRKNEQKSV